MTQEIPLSLIDHNPYNSRTRYDEALVRALASSLSRIGLLSAILVRPKTERFEIVFGHRRAKAAALLGWNTIRADVKLIDDDAMIELSLAENLAREDLSDYEKALCFYRMKKEFGKTYQQIGKIAGFSESHVCNYVRMVELFDDEIIAKNPAIISDLHSVSEHHARILLRISDQRDRLQMLRLVVAERMSVRDLQRMTQRFRSWFSDNGSKFLTQEFVDTKSDEGFAGDEILEIQRILFDEFRLPQKRDLTRFVQVHSHEGGYSLFNSYPPLKRFDNSEAMEEEKQWFFGDAQLLSPKIRDVRVQFYKQFAVATLFVDNIGRPELKGFWTNIRGTVVFLRDRSGWKIIHEHWSNDATSTNHPIVKGLPGQRSRAL
jgi:ParB/RepB/Spo0J family partition protein